MLCAYKVENAEVQMFLQNWRQGRIILKITYYIDAVMYTRLGEEKRFVLDLALCLTW